MLRQFNLVHFAYTKVITVFNMASTYILHNYYLKDI